MLRCASKKIKADKSLVLVAVRSCGLSLEFADPSMKDDMDVRAQPSARGFMKPQSAPVTLLAHHVLAGRARGSGREPIRF